MSDPREMYTRAVTQTASLVAAVRPDQFDDPTPCTEYDVRALISHIVGGINRTARVGEGGNPLEVAARVDGVADDDWPAVYAQAAARAAAAWADDAKLDALVSVPWGKVPGRGALAGYVQEVLAHGWDLAQSTGQDSELDPEPALFALEFAHRFLAADNRGDEVPFGPVAPVPADAGPYTRLAGWLGRSV
jgi:uncharacterized protein (TIGR03086 family)